MALEVSIKTALSSEGVTYTLSDQEATQTVRSWLDHVLKHECSGELRDPLTVHSIKSLLSSDGGALYVEGAEQLLHVDVDLPLTHYAVPPKDGSTGALPTVTFIVASRLGPPEIGLADPEVLLRDLESPENLLPSNMPPTFEDRCALVLGGGGAKGAAQAGAIRAVKETLDWINKETNLGAQIHYIVGSSIGAFNSVFVSSDKLVEMEDFWKNVTPLHGLRLGACPSNRCLGKRSCYTAVCCR